MPLWFLFQTFCAESIQLRGINLLPPLPLILQELVILLPRNVLVLLMVNLFNNTVDLLGLHWNHFTKHLLQLTNSYPLHLPPLLLSLLLLIKLGKRLLYLQKVLIAYGQVKWVEYLLRSRFKTRKLLLDHAF